MDVSGKCTAAGDGVANGVGVATTIREDLHPAHPFTLFTLCDATNLTVGTGMRRRSRKLTAIDLFSGCGGLTQGLRDARFRVLGAVEIDHLSAVTYHANHPRVRVYEQDIREIDPLEMMRDLRLQPGELGLLAGCPPCQGFSTMRTLNGAKSVEDPRNSLMFEFLRFVRAFEPHAVMMENVPGLATDPHFVEFTDKLASLGYEGEHKVLDVARYGVPQRRRRLIYMAGRGRSIPFAPPAAESRTVRDAIGSLGPAGTSGDPAHDHGESRSERIRELISMIPRDGGSRGDLPGDMQLACHQKCNGFNDVYGRMAWDDVSPTITGGCFNPSKGRFLHPEEDRAITMREAALLQTFPPKYQFPDCRSKSAVALLIGNALPPEFIRRHAACLSERIRGDDE